MAGIYLHIPFCRRACHYCDFHFTTDLRRMDDLCNAMRKELQMRASELSEPVSTIYFGGGTPSLLPQPQLAALLADIHMHFTVEPNTEITLEANPEDLSENNLRAWQKLGINRLSLGTQSFIDNELSWMNRMHTASEAEHGIARAQDCGFDNISIDLIYGLPFQTEKDWRFNLDKLRTLNVQHISSYALTVEERTVLHHRIKKGKEAAPDEDTTMLYFQLNMELLPQLGFEQYEVSNFARAGYISQHNSAYWKNVPYVGIGPAAHSYDGAERSWNVRSNAGYIQALKNKRSFRTSETLSVFDRLNEHILTALRTKWGISRSVIEQIRQGAWQQLSNRSDSWDAVLFERSEDSLRLTRKGMERADGLAADLFF